MREIRQSGSEGGGTEPTRSSLPLSTIAGRSLGEPCRSSYPRVDRCNRRQQILSLLFENLSMARRLGPVRRSRLYRRARRYLKCGNRRRLFDLLTRTPDLLSHIERDASLICLAGWWQHYDVVEWMLEHDADPDLVEEGGNTLLIHAAAENDLRLAQLLLDHGADVERRNRVYETPLGFACAYDAVDVVRLLCERGAEVNGTEGWGHSYLCGVQCAKPTQVESILLSYGARFIHEEPKLTSDSDRTVTRRPTGDGDALGQCLPNNQ